MLILGTNDASSWLFQEAQKKAKGLRHIGCREEEVRGELILVHYSLLGIRPDFESRRYHWTTYISSTVPGTFFNTGMGMRYTDLYIIKLGMTSEDFDLLELPPPVINAGPTRRGFELALDITPQWLAGLGIDYPLSDKYMAHIPLDISSDDVFIARQERVS
ncbi:hypothetical protein ELZ88_24710 (plasmid) [Salmonella enterica subsp. enterica serovar Karamoja]|uniref:Uncharacterized protein n=1 Tax=Salmonella enterica subsp. enterica serovar Karamoja TaxID=2500153 RepID=A0A3Q9MXB6_SALET|nr:hypothetical protein [Salmonella enterica]AZT39723.1 hypothetical protein ELZ88_24710 [Salmonella enterica subsp. enterica serovar Karamoja]AZT44375.1 hypothetical protein EL007_24250 [Salmonella enterica subsp. enterica serovar Karamoja]